MGGIASTRMPGVSVSLAQLEKAPPSTRLIPTRNPSPLPAQME